MARLRQPEPEPEEERPRKPKPSERFADLRVYPGGLAHDDPRMARAPAPVPLPPVDPVEPEPVVTKRPTA